jgi:hypothetical protein
MSMCMRTPVAFTVTYKPPLIPKTQSPTLSNLFHQLVLMQGQADNLGVCLRRLVFSLVTSFLYGPQFFSSVLVLPLVSIVSTRKKAWV